MKKVISVLSLFSIIFSFSTNNSLASCTPYNGFNCTSGQGQIFCQIGSNKYCCDRASDCVSPSGSPPPIMYGAPTQDVTAGCPSASEVYTAIGCVNFHDIPTFTGSILKWLVGIGGGVAFLLILSGSFSVMTSSGNPERLKAGQDVITAAVSGLVLLIFSIFVLKLVGVDILGLGAFGFGN